MNMSSALPLLITTLRDKGYKFVQVSDLIGKSRSEVMPPIKPSQRWQARIDAVAFFVIAFFYRALIFIFFVGDALMGGRLIIIGVFALIDRLRERKIPPGVYQPRVAVPDIGHTNTAHAVDVFFPIFIPQRSPAAAYHHRVPLTVNAAGVLCF